MSLNWNHHRLVLRESAGPHGEGAAKARRRPRILGRLKARTSAHRSQVGPTRRFVVEAGGEADQLALAFQRYLELHGRALTDPRSGCAMARQPGRRTETDVLTFWSKRAADDFDLFWRRYRGLYGAPQGEH